MTGSVNLDPHLEFLRSCSTARRGKSTMMTLNAVYLLLRVIHRVLFVVRMGSLPLRLLLRRLLLLLLRIRRRRRRCSITLLQIRHAGMRTSGLVPCRLQLQLQLQLQQLHSTSPQLRTQSKKWVPHHPNPPPYPLPHSPTVESRSLSTRPRPIPSSFLVNTTIWIIIIITDWDWVEDMQQGRRVRCISVRFVRSGFRGRVGWRRI